jgi:hypothetical protein
MRSLLLLAVLLSGCDLVSPQRDTTAVLTGRVIADGAPVVGLAVTFERARAVAPYARTTTRGDGTFEIDYVFEDYDESVKYIYINENPYNQRYSIYRETFLPGTRRDLGDIDVTRPPAP